MFDLKCKKTDCEYNKNYNCGAKEVEIEKDTECETYKKSDIKETEEKIDQPAVRKNIEVGCSADCIFNRQFECAANGITVEPCLSANCPNCATFMPR